MKCHRKLREQHITTDELTDIETTSMTELVHVRKHSAMNKPVIEIETKNVANLRAQAVWLHVQYMRAIQ